MILNVCFTCRWSRKYKNPLDRPCPVCGQRTRFFDSPDRLNILHADLDAFFASVEILDNPELTGKPVIVGGNPKSRGVVSTCNYEARQYGVHSAMPLYQAYRRCPQAVFLPGRMNRYVELSRRVFQIFESFTPDYEPLSIDEAFLDMKGSEAIFGHPIIAAVKLKQKVLDETGLTVSIGVAHNKFLAKLASGEKKPDGLFVLTPAEVQDYLDHLPIERMWGIGSKTLPRIKAGGLRTIRDLRLCPESRMKKLFGNSWRHFYRLSRGQDDRSIETLHAVKSVGNEVTLAKDLTRKEEIMDVLWPLCERVGRRLNRKGLKGKTLTLKLKTHRFKRITRSRTQKKPLFMDIDLYHLAEKLLQQVDLMNQRFRLIGISVSNFHTEFRDSQLSLFHEVEGDRKKEKVNQAVHCVKDRFGDKAITRGLGLSSPSESSVE